MGPIRSGFRAVSLDSLGRLRRSHTDPGLEAAGSPAFGVGDGEDSASITHQRKRLPNADEERLRLRIKRRVPLFQGDLQRRLEKRGHLGTCVAHENVELPELSLQLAKHVGDLFWTGYIGVHQDTIGPTRADLVKRLFRGPFVLVVVNRDLHAMLRQGQRNSSPDAARAASDQCVLSIRRHMNLLGLRGQTSWVARPLTSWFTFERPAEL